VGAKMKRSSSAGPPSSRDQRKSDQERRDEMLVGVQKPFHNHRQLPDSGRRTSIATQTDGMQNGRQLSPTGRNDFQGPRKSIQNGIDRDSAYQNNSQDHAHPRSTLDRRVEGSMRGPDGFRDSNGFGHPRERGDNRSERGRGSYRGRGGHAGYNNGNSLNAQSFSAGHSNQQGPPGYAPSKAQSYSDSASVSQSQIPPFPQPPREGRPYRANSRSQTGPNPNPPGYGRFTGAGPPMAGQHLPSLQTDVANMYGYQSGHPGIMSAMPYHPYMEHVQLLGMVQMQM
jgi:la-related protein 1